MVSVHYSQEELRTLSFEKISAELSNRVYDAAMLFERLENAGRISGNGHHMAQKVAQKAVEILTEQRNSCQRCICIHPVNDQNDNCPVHGH